MSVVGKELENSQRDMARVLKSLQNLRHSVLKWKWQKREHCIYNMISVIRSVKHRFRQKAQAEKS